MEQQTILDHGVKALKRRSPRAEYRTVLRHLQKEVSGRLKNAPADHPETKLLWGLNRSLDVIGRMRLSLTNTPQDRKTKHFIDNSANVIAKEIGLDLNGKRK